MNYNKLNQIIQHSGLSKVNIASRASIARPTLDNLLSGGDVKISTIEAVADVLGISAAELFGDVASAEDVRQLQVELEQTRRELALSRQREIDTYRKYIALLESEKSNV